MTSLRPRLREYFDRLLMNHRSSDRHQKSMELLTSWLKQRLEEGREASILVVCTGNSRRSVFGSMLGSAAACYLGLNDAHFYSGGTEPSAVNPRTIRALEEIGFQIERTAEVAPPGPAGEPNPIYHMHWSEVPPGKREYSKLYSDQENPQNGFAAVMVCDDAAQNCPLVPGAELRVPLTFEDPKAFDGTPGEVQAYRERRDQIAATMLVILRKAKQPG